MDGLTLAARMPLYTHQRAVPIILIAPLALTEETIRRAGAQIDALVTRPIKPTHLYQQLTWTLTGTGTHAPDRYTMGVPNTFRSLPHVSGSTPLRILLAEDNRMNQTIIVALLRRIGYQTAVAENGLQVLEELAIQTYDVVLMDVQMPEMDGIEATRRIRAWLPVEQQPWIIAITAHALKGDRERLLSAGMNDYISKPVTPEGLIAVLHRVQLPASSNPA
jgi:CheY-like chemotaxis protein